MNHVCSRIAAVFCLITVAIGCTIQGPVFAAPTIAADQVRNAQSTLLPVLYLPVLLQHYDGVIAPFGVENAWQPANCAADAERVWQTGANWTRAALSWSDVQPTEGGPYDWTIPDAYLGALAVKHFSIVLTILSNPDWAALDNVNLPSGPLKSEHVADFVSFVRAVVSRYGQPPYNIEYFEMYNEPDGTRALYHGVIGTWGNYGGAYAQMLQAVYPAVRAANPHARVVLGGLAYGNFAPTGPFIRTFLDDVLRAGGGAYFDVLNFHYYRIQAGEWAAYGTDIIGKTNYLKSKLAEYGVTGKQVISSEVGEFGHPGDTASLEAQAQYVAKVNVRGMSAGLTGVIWFSLHEGTNDSGLMGNGQAKPAYNAYQTMTRLLANERFMRAVSGQEVSPNPAEPVPFFEGYAFNKPGRGENLWVVWLNQGSATIAVRVPVLKVTDKFGAATTLTAGPDGLVRLPLGTSPLYVEF